MVLFSHSSPVLLGLILFIVFKGVSGATFTFMNKCDYTVWPGILGKPDLGTTGFELTKESSRSFQAPAGWSGRFWARTNCEFDDSNRGTCSTADCGSGELNCNGAGATPPATLAEFTLGTGSMDYYDVSLVDGYNLPMMVAASGGSGSCAATGCGVDLNQQCPIELRVEGGDACKSACEAFGKAEYCCNGAFSNPSTCKPSVYSEMFKSACPKSYSYAYDDATSTFTCTGADYTITFCPSSPSLKSSTDSSPKGTDSGSGSGSESQSSVEQSELASTSWLADMATATGDSTRTHHFGFSKASFFVVVTFILYLFIYSFFTFHILINNFCVCCLFIYLFCAYCYCLKYLWITYFMCTVGKSRSNCFRLLLIITIILSSFPTTGIRARGWSSALCS